MISLNVMSDFIHARHKTELGGLLWIDMVSLKRLGLLSDGVSSQELNWSNGINKNSVHVTVANTPTDGTLKLSYLATDRYSGQSIDFNYDVSMVTTRCNYGGYRFWFVCPIIVEGKTCTNRVRKLYCSQGYFGCRQCLGLCYESQNENIRYRSGLYRLLKLENRAEELYESIRRPYYAGKQTRRQKQLYELCKDISVLYNTLDKGVDR